MLNKNSEEKFEELEKPIKTENLIGADFNLDVNKQGAEYPFMYDQANRRIRKRPEMIPYAFVFGNDRLTSYTKIENDGHLSMAGDGTVWDDVRVAADRTRTPTSGAPNYDVFLNGVYIYWFSASTDNSLHFTIQMPHGWAATAITPHVHWVPSATSDGNPANQVVRWGLEYTWAEVGSVFPATNTIYATAHSPADANVTANKHYRTDFASLTPSSSQDDISSPLVCRIFRDADNVADTYEGLAGLIEIDFHYEINSIGSRTITTK